MLRLPGPNDEVAPLFTAALKEELDEEEMLADDESEDSEEAPGIDWKFILGLVLSAVVLLSLFSWWMRSKVVRTDTSQQTAEAAPVAAAPAEAAEKAKPSADNLIMQIENTARDFLEAATVEELLCYVRNPDEVKPKMVATFAGKPHRAVGFKETINDDVVGTSIGEVIVTQARTGDFEMRDMVLVPNNGKLLVDWESWVGWSEMSWEDFRSQRPTEGKWFRVVMTRADYYNYDFKDERHWASYRLGSPDDSTWLFGYAPRTSKVDEEIRPVEATEKSRLLLKLKYPPNATQADQVLIEEVKGVGWLDVPALENP
jgi:hypothetical protein